MKLSAEHLTFAYKNSPPLWQDVSLSVGRGEIFSILGANGAGKSTLLRCLIGFLQPASGRVRLEDGEKIYDASENPREFTVRIGYVPQLQITAYSFLVRDYVVMGRSPHLGLFSHPAARDYELADEIMEKMGIYEIRRHPFNTLSGGQQRQAVIARAIIQDPELIIMDEPTNHLDYGNQFRVLEMIERLAAGGISVILTTHMPDQALYLGGKAGILLYGKFQMGKADEILTEEILSSIYQVKIRLFHAPNISRTLCVAESQ